MLSHKRARTVQYYAIRNVLPSEKKIKYLENILNNKFQKCESKVIDPIVPRRHNTAIVKLVNMSQFSF